MSEKNSEANTNSVEIDQEQEIIKRLRDGYLRNYIENREAIKYAQELYEAEVASQAKGEK